MANLRTIFLLDGSGALLSAACLLLILTHFQEHIGMPGAVLVLLSSLAFCLAVYSLTRSANPGPHWLRGLIAANLLYCLVSATFLVLYWSLLTPLGVGYFILEKAVVLLLVGFEVRVLRNHDPGRSGP